MKEDPKSTDADGAPLEHVEWELQNAPGGSWRLRQFLRFVAHRLFGSAREALDEAEHVPKNLAAQPRLQNLKTEAEISLLHAQAMQAKAEAVARLAEAAEKLRNAGYVFTIDATGPEPKISICPEVTTRAFEPGKPRE